MTKSIQLKTVKLSFSNRRCSARRLQRQKCYKVVSQLRQETPEQAYERRLRESEKVFERIMYIEDIHDFEQQLAAAGDKLVVLEVQSEDICETGNEEEVELQWKLDKEKLLEKQMQECRDIKHRFQRTARECPNTVFLEVAAETEEGQALCDKLGIEVFPTLQLYRKGKLLMEHKGALFMQEDLGQGILYYGDQGGDGLRPSQFVGEIKTRQEYNDFIDEPSDKILTVVLVSLTSCLPCVQVYPAVVALARSFEGFAKFARMWGEESDDMKRLMGELKIMEVPTFLFLRNGVEIGRHVGSSRGDLIGKILEHQLKYGVQPPPTTSPGTRRVKKNVRSK